jgi:hypothetical protein
MRTFHAVARQVFVTLLLVGCVVDGPPPTTRRADGALDAYVFRTGRDGLYVRKAPSRSAKIVGELVDGAPVTIACQTTGDDVEGTTIWDYLPDHGGYVSDYYVFTGVDGFVPGIDRCEDDPGSGKTPDPDPGPTPEPPPPTDGKVTKPEPTPGATIPAPSFSISIQGGLFAESRVRPALESGLTYALGRIAKHVDVAGKKAPAFALTFVPSGNAFVSGSAADSSATMNVPPGYPIDGDNQNFVVNLTVHEIGHILAHHLVAPRTVQPTICINEGLATWIAGKYWMNAGSQRVGSLRAAARPHLQRGEVQASMSSCVQASDAWYKVYGSFFEYLEEREPGAIAAVSNGRTDAARYVAGWQSWLSQ